MTNPAETQSPKLIPEEVLGFDPAIIQGDPLPCGQELCTPLRDNCVEQGTDPAQAVVSCGRNMGVIVLRRLVEAMQGELSLHTQLIQRLSIDPDTGILTRGAQRVLFENLDTTGLLQVMRDQGYKFQFLFGDTDKLSVHNALGDHAGGDTALAAVAGVTRRLYQRGYDVIARNEPMQAEDGSSRRGVLEHQSLAQDAVREAQPFDAVSRFDQGDEILVMSFVPPTEGTRRQPPEIAPEKQMQRVIDAFEGLTVEYPVNPRLTEEEVRQIKEDNPTFEFTVEDGIVRAAVSMSFALVIDRVPVTQEEFRDLRHAADGVLTILKKRRIDIRTRGHVLNLLQG